MRTPLESKVNTVFVPVFGTDSATLYRAAEIPLRLVVRNVGGNVILLAYDSSTLSVAPPNIAGTFQLPPGAESVFVLQPREGMYAASAGLGGVVSIAVSEAIPMQWMET